VINEDRKPFTVPGMVIKHSPPPLNVELMQPCSPPKIIYLTKISLYFFLYLLQLKNILISVTTKHYPTKFTFLL